MIFHCKQMYPFLKLLTISPTFQSAPNILSEDLQWVEFLEKIWHKNCAYHLVIAKHDIWDIHMLLSF